MLGAVPKSFPGHFARRLFVWFVAATVLPLLLLGGIAYFEVHRNLEDDARRLLHRVAKTLGMHTYAKLEQLDTKLALFAPQNASVTDIEGVYGTVTRFTAGSSTPKRGAGTNVRSLLSTRSSADGARQILLEPRAGLPFDRPRRSVLVSPQYLQAPQELLPYDVSFCLLDADSEPLICAGERAASLAAEVAKQRKTNASASFPWHTGDSSGLAAYWSIFLQGRFESPDWAVVVSRNNEDIYAPLARFEKLFPMTLALAIVLAILLASIQLRQRLKPMGEMVAATRRFAGGDFSSRIAIESNDELGTLADAFNHMAAGTDLQFKRLAALAELDRLILSSFDEGRIITLTLDRVSDLVDTRQVAFIALSQSAGGKTLVISQPSAGARSEKKLGTNPDLTHWLASISAPVCMVSNELEELPVTHNTGPSTLFPVCRQGKCYGSILVSWADAEQQSTFLRILQEFSDRLAVALSNAAWEGELFRQAHYDTLTGLPNRALLTDRLEQAMLRADRFKRHCAILFVDLDGFKAINDTLGHHMGDTFLSTAASRLREAARAADSVVRFGGDEFVVLVSDLSAEDDLAASLSATAERLIEALSQPVELGGQRLALGASIGIAIYPGDGDNGAALLRNADAAMYNAKARGRGHAEFYVEQMNRNVFERLAMQQDLTEALNNDAGLSLAFQPQMCAQTGRLMGIETLLRWHHPKRGPVSPGVFIPLAEESGLILQLGEWVLHRACHSFRALRDQGVDIPRLAVNVAANQFWAPGFLTMVAQILEATGLPAQALELEVTEGTVMQDLAQGNEMLAQLSASGIQLALDDFGTGYSSLSYLQRLPLHTLKIDRSFVEKIGTNDASDAIVAAIVALGKRLGLRLVAEGVETPAQARILRQLECDEFQGFLFSRPLTSDALAAWYKELQMETVPGRSAAIAEPT